jgi:magnesium transporter
MAREYDSTVTTEATVESGSAGSGRKCHVVDDRGATEVHFNAEEVERLLAGGRFFWLDLASPEAADFRVLREKFAFHPLALEDSEKFGQRPKLDDYDDYVFLVIYGAAADADRLVEVHCFYSERYLITVHRDDCPAFRDVRRRYGRQGGRVDHPPFLLYHIVDALTDSFFPILADFDDRIDELEDAIFNRAGDRELQEIFRMKRLLVGMRKTITPERDLFAGLMGGGLDVLPGVGPEDDRYFRNVYDHLIRISDLIDSYRDLLTGTMDVYLSTVSNRLNRVMKQLAIIATIFLPLTFITGFFGQNFSWMVNHLTGWRHFLVFGVGIELAALIGFLVMFKRRRWF